MMGITGAHQLPGLVLIDHTFTAPLDHPRAKGEQTAVFAREVRAADKGDADLPWLVFFQGGPGGKSPRPLKRSGWLKAATEHYRVLLLDQRGTGRSTPIGASTLARRGGPDAQAQYLTAFRADAIVRDAELIRRELAGEEPWSVHGQSYGGFCVTWAGGPKGFAAAWPTMQGTGEYGERMNSLLKFVASTTLREMEWHARLLDGDIAGAVSRLKREIARDILVFGSGDLVQTLMQHNLIDDYRLMVFPIVLGSGKRLFREGGPRRVFGRAETKTFESGVVLLTYQPSAPSS